MNEVIVISAIWCPSCLILNKHLKKINSEYPNLKIKKLDYDFDEEEVKQYNAGDKLPIIIVKQEKLIGEKTYEEIIKFLKENNAI